MKLFVICNRIDPRGNQFTTVKVLDHTPVTFTRGVAGWQGEGSGMSNRDIENVTNYLRETAANVQSFTVTLVDSVD